MELTFDDYEQLGGICPREQFQRCKLEAESTLAQLNSSFNIEWNTPESEMLALIALIDEAFNTDIILQSGGQVVSIKVGSYSESRGGSSSSSSAFGTIGRSKEIVGRFARIYLKKIGVIKR